MTQGVWLWGATGTGKSELAYKNDTDETHYTWSYKEDFQNGYNHQKFCILDEFRGQLTMNELLTMCDKHNNCKVPIKNRDPINFTSEFVIVTSCMPPEDLFTKLAEKDKLAQLHRRFKVFQLPFDLATATEVLGG